MLESAGHILRCDTANSGFNTSWFQALATIVKVGKMLLEHRHTVHIAVLKDIWNSVLQIHRAELNNRQEKATTALQFVERLIRR